MKNEPAADQDEDMTVRIPTVQCICLLWFLFTNLLLTAMLGVPSLPVHIIHCADTSCKPCQCGGHMLHNGKGPCWAQDPASHTSSLHWHYDCLITAPSAAQV